MTGASGPGGAGAGAGRDREDAAGGGVRASLRRRLPRRCLLASRARCARGAAAGEAEREGERSGQVRALALELGLPSERLATPEETEPALRAELTRRDAPFLGHRRCPRWLARTRFAAGSAGILTRGRRIDYIVAGTGLGLAGGTKYTAGIVLLPLLAAACRMSASRPPDDASLSDCASPGCRQSPPSCSRSPGSSSTPCRVLEDLPVGSTQRGDPVLPGRSPGDSGGSPPLPPSSAPSPWPGVIDASRSCSFLLRSSSSSSWASRTATSAGTSCRSSLWPVSWPRMGSFGSLTACRDLLPGWHQRSRPLLHWCCFSRAWLTAFMWISSCRKLTPAR